MKKCVVMYNFDIAISFNIFYITEILQINIHNVIDIEFVMKINITTNIKY